jgi:hypothetical protein|tara:strand:- start:37 stop:198 length:162 start_codon:yes stop_codon:yes gene_type:complete
VFGLGELGAGVFGPGVFGPPGVFGCLRDEWKKSNNNLSYQMPAEQYSNTSKKI